MKTQNTKTKGEKVFFYTLFAVVGIYILWTISTMFISYDEYENLLKSILN
jgi:cell division protein FtsL